MIRVVETYRDYEDPRALERQLQDFLKKHPNENEWSDYDYETYYDLKDRINFAWQDEEYDMDIYDESCLTEFYNAPLHDKLKQDGYTYVGSQGGWYCYQKNSLGGGRPKYKAFPMNADNEDAIEDVSYEQVKGKDPMPYDLDTMDYYGRGKRGGLSYRFAYESRLTESDFTGDPLLPDVRDVYDELVRMYDVRKDVGYVETAKAMAEYVGGKAYIRTSRSKIFDAEYIYIDWIVKNGEFKYTGYSCITSDYEMADWYRYIEDLCMAYYKANGGKGGYTPALIKAIGRG